MRIRNVALLFGAVLVLMTILTAESGGSAKGGDTTPAGGRRGRSAIDPAAAAAEPTADELLAQTLQDEENKEVNASGTSGSGGPSDAHLAKLLQDEENKMAEIKSPESKKRKVMPQLKAKPAAAAGASSSDATDVIDHLEVDIQGDGPNQRVRVFGDGTMFPNIQALLPRIGFIKREEEYDRFRPNMVSIEAETLFEYMRSHSSHLHDATQKALMANLKRFLAEQSELPDPEGEACRAAGATKSAFGGRTSFSPKKPKGPDARPAILARKTWTINIDRKRGLVTVGGTHWVHRGVLQMALGESARMNNEGFKFDKERKEWIVTFNDVIEYNQGADAEDIDEDYIAALLLLSIEAGNERVPDNRPGNDGRRPGSGAAGGYGGGGA